jgi:hypothetical protein
MPPWPQRSYKEAAMIVRNRKDGNLLDPWALENPQLEYEVDPVDLEE